MLSVTELAALDALQLRYARALDLKQMDVWLACFATRADASYLCNTHESHDQGLDIALMMDDNHARLEDRVTFITKIWAGTFQDYRTRHFCQRTEAERTSDTTIQMSSNFMVLYTPEDKGTTEVLVSGSYEDVILEEDGRMLFLHRKSLLDTAILPRYLIYPL